MTHVTCQDHATASSLLWTSNELLQHGAWTQKLPEDVREELLAFVANNPGANEADFVYRREQWPRLASFAQGARRQLLAGEGLLRIVGLAQLPLNGEHMRCFYAAMGASLGEPMLSYGRLYPVLDRGRSHKDRGVPVSMTNAETCFHTDSSSVDVVPDFVGLLCEEPSNRGGASLVSNALLAHATLQREAPGALALLEAPMIRDVVTPGKAQNYANLIRNRFPVFAPSDQPGGVLFRYMRFWIETGQDRAGEPLTGEQVAALDRLDELLQREEHVVRFQMERSDILWVNNRILAHNRTSYRDTKCNVRRLQRMWIQASGSR